MSEFMTISAIRDSIITVFRNTKRQNLFCKFNKITTNQFYFYTFVGQLYTNQPLTVYSSDLEKIKNNLLGLNERLTKLIIETAIKYYLIEEGQGVLLQSKNNKWSWRLI